MKLIKKFKTGIIAIVASAIVLAICFCYPNTQYHQVPESTVETVTDQITIHTEPETEENSPVDKANDSATEPAIDYHTNESDIKTVTDDTSDYTEPETEENSTVFDIAPSETAEPDAKTDFPPTPTDEDALFCSLTVRCNTLLANTDMISPEKIKLIPENGIILPETKVEFTEGESAFDVLERELKRLNIHFEFTKNPMYDSIYIEGIGNLYEFDAGPLSGWLYRVNGNVLSVGCSQYKLKTGDKLEFLYTCNMGKDL